MEHRSSPVWFVGLSLFVLLAGCGKKSPPVAQTAPLPTPVVSPEPEQPAVAEFVPEPAPSSPLPSAISRGFRLSDKAETVQLQRIHFEFDRANITPEAREILTRNAAYLRRHPELEVEVGGHCDERGSTDYNIALGERRAQAAARFLEALGISSQRLKVVSYGEDRPLSPGHTEYDYALNRRVEFRPLNR